MRRTPVFHLFTVVLAALVAAVLLPMPPAAGQEHVGDGCDFLNEPSLDGTHLYSFYNGFQIGVVDEDLSQERFDYPDFDEFAFEPGDTIRISATGSNTTRITIYSGYGLRAEGTSNSDPIDFTFTQSVVADARLFINQDGDTNLTWSVACTQEAIDTTPPTITVPDDVTLEAPADTNPSNTGTATATDDTDPDPEITFTDVVTPGSCPAEYEITRTWVATDDTGNTASAAQSISVVDTTPPVLTVPADITVSSSDGTDPAVTGQATAEDAAGDVTITYTDTQTGDVITRTWVATDDCGNLAQAAQLITIEADQPTVDDLIGEVESLELPNGIENALTSKLHNAVRDISDGLYAEAQDKLEAFINQVEAQSGKKIDAGDADDLIALAMSILATL
jgi:hypothetical protein